MDLASEALACTSVGKASQVAVRQLTETTFMPGVAFVGQHGTCRHLDCKLKCDCTSLAATWIAN
eukprot:1148576-Pelagomonas_calceolata.AAC.6